MLFGKTLASGYQPIGAAITTTEVAEKFIGSGKEFKMAHTLSGHPAGTAAALANQHDGGCSILRSGSGRGDVGPCPHYNTTGNN